MGIELGKNSIKINGKSTILLCSSFFYFRVPRALWARRLDDLKAAGYNCVDAYFPWNYHEVSPGKFDFSGERDAAEFLRLCGERGLYVIARPGPYICSEWDGGSLPSWICSYKNIRQNDADYLDAVKEWYIKIMPVIKRSEIGNGGSVILVQIENELDFFDCKDVAGMISALKNMALQNGIGVPLFCCAGQGDIKKAGGLTDGIIPTYNFYPRLDNKDFDGVCRNYAEDLKTLNIPLLVSETGREHSLLKRELMAGAKLLGAYNQVAGSNFEYYHAVNNWGSPLSVLTTRYDFNSMITTLGDYNAEADEAVVFSSMLAALGENLAEAEIAEAPVKIRQEYICPNEQNNLRLKNGGYLLCLANLSGTAGEAFVEYGGEKAVKVSADTCLALPLGVNLGSHKINFSNYEIFRAGKELIFIGEGLPYLDAEIAGEKFIITEDGVYDRVSVRFMTKKTAAELYKKERGLKFAYSADHQFGNVSGCTRSEFVNNKKFVQTESLRLCDNGIWYGGIEARIFSEKGKEVFLENVADFMTVLEGGEPSGALYGGECITLPPPENGEYLLRVEKWGHSNFDDSRMRSLNIGFARGIKEAYSVIETVPLNVWKFTTYQNWENEKLEFSPDPFHPRLDPNSWNSSAQPLIGLYYKELAVKKGYDAFVVIDGGDAEARLYIDGVPAGAFHNHDKAIKISGYINGKEKTCLQLLVRKRDWAQRTGNVKLLYVKKCAYEIRPFGKDEIISCASAGKTPAQFPLSLKAGKTEIVEIDLREFADMDCYGAVSGDGYKLTAVYGNKVIARMIGQDKRICQQGGSDTQFFIPSCYKGGKLEMVVEALKDAVLDFKIEYNKNLV